MSRPRYWWYDYVKKATIQSMNSKEPPATLQECIAAIAVRKALDDTGKKYRGEERLELFDLVYRRRQYNIPCAALHMNISEGTACIWAREFMYSVAEHMGFL